MTLWSLVFITLLVNTVLGQDDVVRRKCEKIYRNLPPVKYTSANIQPVRPPPSVKPPSKKTIKKAASKLNLIAVNTPAGKSIDYGDSTAIKPIRGFVVEDICEQKETSLTLGPVILDGGRYCWLLYPHVGYTLKRVQCISRLCKDVKGLNVIPVPTCFFCRPDNFKIHVAYYICSKGHGKKWSLIKKTWDWPQCCSCKKFTSLTKG